MGERGRRDTDADTHTHIHKERERERERERWGRRRDRGGDINSTASQSDNHINSMPNKLNFKTNW